MRLATNSPLSLQWRELGSTSGFPVGRCRTPGRNSREGLRRLVAGRILGGGLRFLVRILGYLLVAGGFVVLLTDGARSIANSALRFTSLGETLLALLGDRYRQLQPGVERNLHPLLWDPVLLHLMLAPTALAGLLLGFLLLWLGAEPKPIIGIVTRR